MRKKHEASNNPNHTHPSDKPQRLQHAKHRDNCLQNSPCV